MNPPSEPDLSDRYNDGLVPPPQLTGEPARLPRPAWQPTPAQVDFARQRLTLNIIILVMVTCLCLAALASSLGWSF
jgi:hypothetical protein